MKITHPKLDWRGATPVAQTFGDIYYSPEDAVGEVRHNFVSCVAPLMGQRGVIVIGETGFGTGLNFLVTWHDWLACRRYGDRLIFVSTEAHPMGREDVARALRPFDAIQDLAGPLIKDWPVGIPGPHRRFFDVGSERGMVELWVLYGDAFDELQRQNFQADAWYFDGFNPSENPALWTPELMAECARLMTPGARAGTFTVAGAVRRAMQSVGLETEKHPGFGRKRECLKIQKPEDESESEKASDSKVGRVFETESEIALQGGLGKASKVSQASTSKASTSQASTMEPGRASGEEGEKGEEEKEKTPERASDNKSDQTRLLPLSLHVVGDGIAAASLCHAAHRRGYAVTYEGQENPARASGNPLALVNFKPTKAPLEPSNRMLSACLAQVQSIYADLWLKGRGTHKPARDAAELAEFEACHRAMGWSDEALEITDVPGLGPGLFSNLAGYLSPKAVLKALFQGARKATKNHTKSDTKKAREKTEQSDTQTLADPSRASSNQTTLPGPRAATCIYAQGYGTIEHAPSLSPVLRRNIGQVDVFAGPECSAVPMPITYGGYMTPPFAEGVLSGSTYDRDPDWQDPAIWVARPAATEEIVAKASQAGLTLPNRAQRSYVSARAFGQDHRPLVGQTSDGVWVLTGLGSRGFLTGPLLAEILLDDMEGRESAGLPTYDFKACVDPKRFQKKTLRKNLEERSARKEI